MWSIIMVAGGLMLYFIVSNLGFIHYQVVAPLDELTLHIECPQDSENIERYIAAIKKRDYQQ